MALQIDGHDFVPVWLSDGVDWPLAVDAGVVHQDVDLVFGVYDVVHPRLDRLAVRHFDRRHVGGAAELGDRFTGFFCVCLVRDVADGNGFRALRGECECHRFAEAAAATGNQAHLAFKSICH